MEAIYACTLKYTLVILIGLVDMNSVTARFKCGQPYGWFPHNKDCSRFYICAMWSAFPMKCPPGLHFNPLIEVCDWVANAGCGLDLRVMTENQKNLANVASRMGTITGKLAQDVTGPMLLNDAEHKHASRAGSDPFETKRLIGGKKLALRSNDYTIEEPLEDVDANNEYIPVESNDRSATDKEMANVDDDEGSGEVY